MSLLLDALKKAANEKKQLAGKEQIAPPCSDTDLTLEALPEVEAELKPIVHNIDTVPLTAESAEETSAENSSRSAQPQDNYLPDEALKLLVNKTNTEHRKNKILRITGITLSAFVILLAGGLYFFQSMQKNVDQLEKRHRSIMRQVSRETANEVMPKTSPVIKKLISDNKLEQKIADVKQAISKMQRTEKKISDSNHRDKHHVDVSRIVNVQKKSRQQQHYTATQPIGKKNIYIQKKHMADPVSVLLDNAWNAYEQGDYNKASVLYKKVLSHAKNNHDALLGLGAIAVQNKSMEQAQQYYFALLKLNPEDPDAIAALSSMDPAEQSGSNEVKIKDLLGRNPGSAPLNFALGNLYAKQKKWSDAQSAYFNAWVYDSTNPAYAFNLAVSLDHLEKWREAKKFYQQSLSLAGRTNAGFSKQSVKNRLQQISNMGIVR